MAANSPAPAGASGLSPFRTAPAVFFILLIILAAAGRLAYGYFSYLRSPEPALQEVTLVEVAPGMTFRQIARLLEGRKVVSHRRYFELAAVQKRVTTRMQAGTYTFRPGYTPLQVLDIISRGDVTVWKLAAPEGLSIYEIGRRLAALGNWSEEKFVAAATDAARAHEAGAPVASLEGYLFPAVYNLRLSMSEDKVAELMLARGKKEMTEARLARARQLGLTWHQVLTLASLVEKETAARDEMPLIAGVFMDRLKHKMPLQSDPTVVYGDPDFTGPITKKDLLRPGPYNTYLHQGLPPGPICNPGADAIEAALHPSDTGYLYFVADGSGRHVFSKTYLEHLKNVIKYRKGQ
ncbi:MAG TPA: endolytic transglycosylase MltG [bacterium]|nr:endolytic transglycosylase MltG [bacterium]